MRQNLRSPLRWTTLAACALFALLGAGSARAQGGVWSTIPVPGVAVFGVADGDSGRVLIASNTGAFRFDGFRMRRLPIFSPDTDSLKGNTILRSRLGDIWFGTGSHGLFRLSTSGLVTRYTAASGLGNSSNDDVLCLAEGLDGQIWAGTRLGGLSHFDGVHWTTVTTDQGLPSMTVNSIAINPGDGAVWAACTGNPGGLAYVLFDFAINYPGPGSDPAHAVHSVIVTPNRRVWAGYAGGIAEMASGVFHPYPIGAGDVATALAEGAHGELWFGTGNRGVGFLDAGRVFVFPSGPPSANIRGVYVDPAGALWTSSDAGLGRFEGAAFLSLRSGDGLPNPGSDPQVYSVLGEYGAVALEDSIDAHGIEWIGLTLTQTGPTSFFNLVRRANGRLRLLGSAEGLPRAGAVSVLAAGDSGSIWLGTLNGATGGVAHVDVGGQLRQVLRAADGLPSTDVAALRGAGGNAVWIGTTAGAALYNGAAMRALPTGPAFVPDATIRGIDLDPQGRVWLATGPNPRGDDGRPGGGAVRFDPSDSSYVHYDVAAGLPTNSLTSAAVFTNGDVWFGSTAGAIRLRGSQVSVFGPAQGVPSAQVNSVREGAPGEAWAATSAGLAAFDGQNWTSFNVGDGLASSTIFSLHASPLEVMAGFRGEGVTQFHPDRTPPRADIVAAPPIATGARDAQFAVRGGDLDSGTRGILLSYQMDNRPPTPFLEDVTSASFTLADGDHAFKLWAKDRALNVTPEPEVWTFTVDATPPRPIVQKPAFNAIVRDTVAVIGSVADSRFASYTIEVRAEGAERWDTLFVSTSLPASGDTLYRWDTTAQLDGVWELRVGAVDSLGLVGYVQVTTIVDNLAPSASVTSPAHVDHVQGGHVFTTGGEVELDIPPNAWDTDQIVRIDPIPEPPVLPPGAPAGSVWASGWLLRASVPVLAKPATLIVHLPGVPLGVPVAFYKFTVNGTDTTLVAVGAGAGFAGARGLDVQPRVVSPNGGGFDTRAAISFDVGRPGSGAVKVFDRAGRLVREVAESAPFTAGRNVVFWDGKDGEGRVVPSGLYVVAVRLDGQTSVASVAVANR